MIHSVLILSQTGQPRLARFYEKISTSQFKSICQKLTFYLNRTTESSSNFIFNDINLQNIFIVYRRYGALYFIVLADELENELACLDVIQCFAETLNLVFQGVDENDLVTNVDKINYVLDEIICCGSIVCVDKNEAFSGYRSLL
ncbi:Sigma adaptin [Spironucleus salmonicida]|uniref:AP complex subunit sigma n=1 Tax=Spironucleus salmonicida TaxID=348837 RepID=V6LCD3_9EUKA|nr:Sigma adaptin [Spironucleus salmonicida]|eukprot:EST42132.1 Sigma adaptin [Spironucleus salmonicida]